MLVIFVLVSFVCIFLAGMHYAIWDQFGFRNSLFWAGALTALGLYITISMISYTKNLS